MKSWLLLTLVLGAVGFALVDAGVVSPASAFDRRPRILVTVRDVTANSLIRPHGVLTSPTTFEVSMLNKGGDCAGNYLITALGAPGNPPSVIVHTAPFIVGPAAGSNLVLSPQLVTGVENRWKISVVCHGPGRRQFDVDLFEFSVKAP